MFKTRRSIIYLITALALITLGLIFAGRSKKEAVEAHDESIAHEEEGHSKVVKLDDDAIKEFNIETGIAGPGQINIYKIVPAEVAFNADRLAHIVPRVPGVVREVFKNLGQTVKAGDLLAIIDSRELADSRAAYLAGVEKLSLAEANFKREETLWQKKITAEQEYLDAKSALADAKIALRSAEQKLHALGFSEEYLKQLPKRPEESFIKYEIVSPIDGTIVEKHIVLGEVLKEDTPAFLIADLNTVWVNLSIHQKDLAAIKKGQPVIISAGNLKAQGKIDYISSTVNEESRTTSTIVELPNTEQLWRPGLFASGKIIVEDINVPIAISKEAVVMFEGNDCVFVKDHHGFELRKVTLGRTNDTNIEVVSGLNAGEEYVFKGAFTLKSELKKPTEDEHGH